MANGTVLTKSKDGELGRYDDDHPAVELKEALEEQGGEATVRAMGYRMTSDGGGKLGFCVPKKEGYVVYLTTIPHDSEVLEEFDLEVSKGSGGLAVIKDLGKPTKALKTLKAIYAAAEEAKPEKPKKAKAKKDKDEADEKPKKGKGKKKAKAKDTDDEEPTSSRKRRRKKNKKAADDDDE